MGELVKPKVRQGGEDLALARYRGRQDDIKGGQTICLYDEQVVVVHLVDVAYLAAMQ